MLAVLTSVVVATVALIPGAEAGLSASSVGTRDGTYTTTPVKKTVHTTKTSSVKCTAKATATSYAHAADGFAYAMADAFKWGCSANLDDDWKVMVSRMRGEDYAYAFAYAAATADVRCVSKGNAYGCASAHANAKAWAKAVLHVYASAWATAINQCSCRRHTNEAIASDYGTAEEWEYLVAKVEAEASAYVCVSGDDKAVASAESRCYHSIYATGFAKAFAKALIDGECYSPYHGPGLEAEAKIKAVATIDRWDYIDC